MLQSKQLNYERATSGVPLSDYVGTISGAHFERYKLLETYVNLEEHP